MKSVGSFSVLSLFWSLLLASQLESEQSKQLALEIGSDDPVVLMVDRNGTFQDQTETLLQDPEGQSSSNLSLTQNERCKGVLWSAVLLAFYTDIAVNGLFIGLLHALQSNVVRSCGSNPDTVIAGCAPSVHNKVQLYSQIFLPLTAASFVAFFGSMGPSLFKNRSTPQFRAWIISSGMEAVIWLFLMAVVVSITVIPERKLSVGDFTTMLPAALIARGISLAQTHLIALLV